MIAAPKPDQKSDPENVEIPEKYLKAKKLLNSGTSLLFRAIYNHEKAKSSWKFLNFKGIFHTPDHSITHHEYDSGARIIVNAVSYFRFSM